VKNAEQVELPIPAVVDAADRATEMVRIWLVDGDQCVVLSPNLWPDPAAWGLMLVDLARHVSKAYGAQGQDPSKVLKRIREAFDAEWGHPTDKLD
jgi:Domain of unknown function (DUF5076)